MQTCDQGLEIVGPAYGNRNVSDRVFDDQIPANDPRHDFTERCVRVCVSRTGDRDHRGKLGIAKSSEAANDCGNDKRDHQRRTGAWAVRIAGSGSTDSCEDSSTDDGAYSEKRELNGTKRAAELMLGFFGVFEDRVERLDAKQATERRSDARLV